MKFPEFNNEHYDKIAFSSKFYDDPSSTDLIIDIMVEFLQNEFKREFKKSIENKDLDKFYFILHKLKGSAATTCMLNLYKYCLELESITFEDEELMETKVNQLNEEIEIIIKMINDDK